MWIHVSLNLFKKGMLFSLDGIIIFQIRVRKLVINACVKLLSNLDFTGLVNLQDSRFLSWQSKLFTILLASY